MYVHTYHVLYYILFAVVYVYYTLQGKTEGDAVFIRNFQTGDKWLPDVISKQTGPVSYIVKLTNECEGRCHQDQLQKRTVDVTLEDPVQIDNPIPKVIGDQNGEQTLVEPSVVALDGNEVKAQPVLDPIARKTYPTRNRTAV